MEVQSVIENNRASFSSAYNTLELAIKSFSKEKLMFEQRIDGLNSQISAAGESFQKLNLGYQDLKADNQKLLALHEENEENKLGLSALIANVESKLEIISETVEGLEKVEQHIYGKYEDHTRFIAELKFRQMQLLQWIDNCQKQNLELQNNVVELTNQLDQEEATYENQKSLLTTEISELKSNISQTEVQLNATRNEKELLSKSLEDVKEKSRFDLELQTNLHMQEKSALEDQIYEIRKVVTQFELQAEVHTQEFEALTNTLTDCKKNAEAQLEHQAQSHAQEIVLLKNQLEETKKNAETEVVQLAQLHAQEIAILKNQLEEIKQNAESEAEQRIQLHAQETDILKIQLEETKKNAETEAEQHAQLYAQDIQILNNQLEETKNCAKSEAEQVAQFHAEEIATLKIQLEETKQNAESKAEQLAQLHVQETDILKIQLQETKQNAESEAEKQSQIHAEEMEVRRKTIETHLEELADLTKKIAEMSAASTKEKEELSQECERKLCLAEKEKEDLICNHKTEMDNQNQEYQLLKNEFRVLQKRYHDQKHAITKLVEEVGVRPVILPSIEEDLHKAKASVAPVLPLSFERPKMPNLVRPSPKPVTPLTPSRVESSQSHGILKRPNENSISEKGKNVSFGAPLVTDFIISSGSSDADSDFNDHSERSHKRLKTSREENGDKNDENLKDKTDQENKGNISKKSLNRRYFRKGVGQPRRNSSLI